MKNSKSNIGFTLIEILMVVGLVTILISIVIIAINPAIQFAQARNTQRSSNVNIISDAVYQYIIENQGSFPNNIDSSLRMIGTANSGCNVECGQERICTGYEWDSHCWYEGGADLTCVSVCASHGGNEDTCQENDNSSCDLCHHFHPGRPCQSQSFGMAPYYETGGNSCRYRSSGVSGSCLGKYYSRHRYCACNGDLANTESSCLDLASDVVGSYLPEMPYDPKLGSLEKTYYAIRKVGEERVEIISCKPELDEEIKSKK